MNVAGGSQREVRFYFARRELTVLEDERFFNPNRTEFPGLPDGVGYDPPFVFLEYKAASESLVVLGTPPVVKDAPGEYHGILACPTSLKGVWVYRGYGEDEEGNGVASTQPRSFTVV